MASSLVLPSALLYILIFCETAGQSSMADADMDIKTSQELTKMTTISFSAGCPSSSTQTCLALKSNYQDPAILQDGHASTSPSDALKSNYQDPAILQDGHVFTSSSEPIYNTTPINLQHGSYNSTTTYIPFDQIFAEAQRVYGFIIKVNWYLIVVLYPCVGVIGLVVNILSAIILIRSGLGKPSNIFLLAIALADSFCLLGAANIAYILMHIPNSFPFGVFLWQFSRSESFACYVFGVAFYCLSAYGIYVSAALCTVVTIERFIAVYFPLHFINIVTPFRAWLVCLGCFLFWLPYLIFGGIMWYRFDYTFYHMWNIYGGEMKFKVSEINILLEYYWGTIFGKFIPLAIVIAGSVLIAIRVSITLRKRQKMVAASSKPSSSGSRTTTTLLVVCCAFAVTKILALPTYFFTPTTDSQLIMFWSFYGSVVNLAEYANGFCNFFIYVFLNKKFRVVFFDIFSRKKR